MRSAEALSLDFRARGRKVTPQRQRIFAILAASTTHPTAEAVYEQVRASMPTVSLRTVYQALNDLVALGELQALDLGTGSTRFDPNVSPHHHLVCGRCGRVEDLDLEFPGVVIPAHERRGFRIDATEIVFRGRCADCGAAGDEASTASHQHTGGDQHDG